MHICRVATALLLVITACSSAESTDSVDQPTEGKPKVSSSSGGSSSGGSSSGGSSSGGSSSGGSSSGGSSGVTGACGLAGIWSGPVQGTYVDLLKPDKRLPVTGSATVKLDQATGDTFPVNADSGIEIVLKDILGPGRDSTVKRPLSGTSTCQTLQATGNGDTGIIKIKVAANCTFARSVCDGQWTAVTPGKNGAADTDVANGTFSLTKRD